MARYIDVEPLEDKLKEHIRKTEIELMLGALSTFLRLLDITPTADVAPVRHGMWVDVDRMQMHDLHGVLTWGNSFMCTECNFKTFAVEGHMSQYHYCPNCGARMDGENGDVTAWDYPIGYFEMEKEVDGDEDDKA